MSKNLLVIVPMPEVDVETSRQAAGEDWTVEYYPKGLAGEELLAALNRADAVIGEPDPAVLKQYADAQPEGNPKLKLIQMTWAGTDKYTRCPIPFPKGITLCNAVGGFGHIISQQVVAQTLSIMQNLPAYRANQLASTWKDLGPVQSLDDATVVIFGAGDLGGHVARRLAGFDCHVVGVCNHVDKPRQGFDELCTLDQAEGWLPKADVVINCLPNSDATAYWLNETRLSEMKQGSVLVNVGRGNFIDCMALAKCLAAGHLRGAALDVTDPEPLPADHPLWLEPRCVITPHVAGGSFGRHRGTETRIRDIAVHNLHALEHGEAFRNVVFSA